MLKRFVETGDREALGALFSRYVDMAYATAMRVCRNSADAEDAVQTAFMQVMNNAGSYRGESEHGVRAWLMMIVINSCKKAIRGEVRRRQREEFAHEDLDEAYEDEPAGGLDVDLKQRTSEIMEELDYLPEQYRMAIWLRYYEGLSEKAAAETLGVSEKNLNNSVYRGMTRLRQRLAARGVAATVGGLALAMPGIGFESAPAALATKVAGIAAGTLKVAAAATATNAGLGVLALKLAVPVVAVGVAGYFVWENWDTRKLVRPPPAEQGVQQPTPKSVHYKWDFNEPGVLSEFKALRGGLKHVPNGGRDGSGCLETEGDFTNVLVPIPITDFPFVVSWECRAVVNRSRISKSSLRPMTNVAQFLNIITNPTLRDVTRAWAEHVDYYSEDCVIRTMDGVLNDVAFGVTEKDPILVISLQPQQRLDNLEIRSIAPGEMPDSQKFRSVIDAIPPEDRTGRVRVGSFGDSGLITNLTVWFVPRVSRDGQAEE